MEKYEKANVAQKVKRSSTSHVLWMTKVSDWVDGLMDAACWMKKSNLQGHAMRKCSFSAYADSNAQDRSANLNGERNRINADNEGPDQTAHMCSLIWAFAVRFKIRII